MNHWWFLLRLKHKQVLRAITDAESVTSGEIRVCVSHRKSSEPLEDAREQFEKLGMSRTRERNGVLIFIAPRSRSFAIVGDEGIHAKCGDAFWNGLSSMLSTAFREERWTEGLIEAVKRAGELLAQHFPRQSDDRNELPDEIAQDTGS